MSTEVCAPGGRRRIAGLVHFRDSGKRCCFNYTDHLDQLIRNWCSQYPELSHIDMDRVILSVARCRSGSGHGVYANITSLKFPFGPGKPNRADRVCRWPKVTKNGCEALYLIRFYLPRFHNLSFEAKVTTILHELYHIQPKFNGEFRNFGGKHWAHGPSQEAFDRMFAPLTREILKAGDPVCDLFLNCHFAALLKRVGDVYGDRYSWVTSRDDMPVVS